MKKDWELLGLLVLTLCFYVNNGQKVGKATFTDRWEYSKIYIHLENILYVKPCFLSLSMYAGGRG